MNASDLPAHLRRKANAIERYAKGEWAGMAAKKIIRFVDGNFRAQGWQGRSFKKWQANSRGGTILIKRGHLRRSLQQEIRPGQVRTWSNARYAAVHNRGFNGTVNVKAHQRRMYRRRRVTTGRFNRNGTPKKKTIHEVSNVVNVKAHVRKMNIAKRQFMPNDKFGNDAPVLVNSIRRQTAKDLKNL